MRPIKVTINNDMITISVGVLDANGNYEVLKLTPAEAAILMMKLQETL